MSPELIANNPLLKISIEFSLDIINYCEELESARKYVLAKQLLRSGTSIGANSMEAQNPDSKADIIHKIKVAAKEPDETQYWLTLCQYSTNYPNCNLLVQKLDVLSKIMNKILYTSKGKHLLVIY